MLNAVSSGVFANVFAHYPAFGETENRAPTAQYASFDAAGYLEANADVAAAVTSGAFSSALDHFIQFGRNESRSGSGITKALTQIQEAPYSLRRSFDSLTGTSNNDTFVGLQSMAPQLRHFHLLTLSMVELVLILLQSLTQVVLLSMALRLQTSRM